MGVGVHIQAARVRDSRLWTLPRVKLSEQQAKVLGMLCAGWRPKEIADVLTLSPRTVSEYILRAMRKLHAQTRDEAVSIFTKQLLAQEPVRKKTDAKRRT